MNKIRLKYIAGFVIGALLCGCNDNESDLLETKVYFEESSVTIKASGDDVITHDLQARLSFKSSSPTEVTYEIGGASAVEAFNAAHGTTYELLDPSQASLEVTSATIEAGKIYAPQTTVKLSGMANIAEGKTYLLPVCVRSSSLPVVEGSDFTYLVISKPVEIRTVGQFSSNYIKIPVSPLSPFTSVTYEALIYLNRFNSNNTIMGTEGILILRIGDEALPGKHNDWMQIAGNKQFHSEQAFETGKWYHVAFTYDQPSGKAILYINGERPFYGYMSEVRLWSVARTENQIKQNMLSVDPASDGLFAYYKLNGKDLTQEGGVPYIKDASGNGKNGETDVRFKELDEPVAIN